MSNWSARLAATAVLLSAMTAPARAQVPTLPAGFEAVRLPGDFESPVALAFAPDGSIWIAEKGGRVRFHDGEVLQSQPVLDISSEVNDIRDRGLLGIALHPGFVPDGGPQSWVYLLYTVSPLSGQDVPFNHDDQYSFSRLTRYRTLLQGDVFGVELASRHVLLGNQLADGSVPDGIASLRDTHSNGSMHFANDGSLILGVGDGSTAARADTGGNDDPGFDAFTHPQTGKKGPIAKVQDLGSFRAQDLRSLAGKLLRIDPETGHGYPSNPFFDGDPSSNASKVWALGLRYPFRISLRPGSGSSNPADGKPGTVYIGDVGWFKWEELEVSLGGENFGWPCLDGTQPTPGFRSFVASPGFLDCHTLAPGTLAAPILVWHHSDKGQLSPPGLHVDANGAPLSGFWGRSVTGGVHYPGGSYPPEYDGLYFFADFEAGWIRTLETTANDQPVAVRDFGEDVGSVVAFAAHPLTGEIHWIDLYAAPAGGIFRLRHGSNKAPVAPAQATPTSGPPSL